MKPELIDNETPRSAQMIWVDGVRAYYRENDITPGDPECGDWVEAHYPTPACLGGTRTIPLLFEHHQIQGVLQAQEYGRKTFWTGDVRRGLSQLWIDDWFGFYELFDEMVSMPLRQEVKDKVAATLSGRTLPEEHKAAIAEGMRRPEAKQRSAEGGRNNKGKPKSAEHRAKIKAALTGKAKTPEHVDASVKAKRQARLKRKQTHVKEND